MGKPVEGVLGSNAGQRLPDGDDQIGVGSRLYAPQPEFDLASHHFDGVGALSLKTPPHLESLTQMTGRWLGTGQSAQAFVLTTTPAHGFEIQENADFLAKMTPFLPRTR